MSGQLRLKAASLGGDITLAPADTANNVVVTVPAVTATMLNDQSNIETQTKTALNASGSAPIYACRAWVNFNGTGTVAIRASGNVSSITDNGTGDYTVNFTTAMSDANYCFQLSQSDAANGSTYAFPSQFLTTPTTSALRVGNIGSGAASASADVSIYCVAIFR